MTPLSDLHREPRIARLVAQLAARTAVEVDEPAARQAAVAIMIRMGSTGPEIFFIERATYEGDPWSGQIAFPGGRWEAHDPDLAATAVRETIEETAIDLRRSAEVVGVLDDLHPQVVHLPSIVVRPFVFLVHDVPPASLSPEVASCFWVPVLSLLDRSRWGEARVRAGGYEMSRLAFKHNGQVIWGMTERILSGLLALLRDDGPAMVETA